MLDIRRIGDDIVQRKNKTRARQFGDPGHQFRGDFDRLQDFQHHFVARQEFDEIAHQHSRIDVDVTGLVADHIIEAQFGRMSDDRGGRCDVVADIGRPAGGAAKQQFVTDKALIAIQNRLACQEEILGMQFPDFQPGRRFVLCRCLKQLNSLCAYFLHILFIAFFRKAYSCEKR